MINCFEKYARGDRLVLKYHDEEWGTPIRDEQKMIEIFILELFQAGLSWKTVLHKRDGFRIAFDDFDVFQIAQYDKSKVDKLMKDESIIRNRRKIEAAVNNARIILSLKEEYGSFVSYIWHFTEGKTIYEDPSVTHDLLSDDVSKDLKKRGMKFAGTVTVFSFLQAAGIVYSHTCDCYRYIQDHGDQYIKFRY